MLSPSTVGFKDQTNHLSFPNTVDTRYTSGGRCECDGVTAALTLAETESRVTRSHGQSAAEPRTEQSCDQ